MLIFMLRRLNLFFFTMMLLTILSFSLSYLFPGDQVINISGQINATPEQKLLLEESYASNSSLIYQYWAYVVHLFQGDFGQSMTTNLPVADEILSRLPATMELTFVALLIAMAIGIPIGFIAAIYHRKTVDNVILSFSMLGYSIPVFWLGLLAILNALTAIRNSVVCSTASATSPFLVLDYGDMDDFMKFIERIT